MIAASFLLISVMAKIISPFGLWAQREKPIFPFSEPSHYALGISYFLVCLSVILNGWRLFVLMLGCVIIFILVKSLTLVIALLLCIACRVNIKILLGLLVMLPLFFIAPLDFTYYTSRLDFSSSTENLSSLVWIFGWQQAIHEASESLWLGSGFQQFSANANINDAAEKIEILTGSYPNTLDGGSMAAKMIGEWGVVGLICICFWMVRFLLSFIKLRKIARIHEANFHLVMAHAGVVSYAIEMLVRGIGYFSPGSYFLFVSIGIFIFGKNYPDKCLPRSI